MKLFTILDEASNFPGHSSTTPQVSSMSADGDSLNVLVRRDLAAVRVLGGKLRAEVARPVSPGKKHEDKDDPDERCAGCEAAVQEAIDVGIVDNLPKHLERGFRQHLVRVLRRRSRLEESLARRNTPAVGPAPAHAPHIFLIQPNAAQSGLLAKQLRVHGVRSGKDRDDRDLSRLVQARPLLVLLQKGIDAQSKVGSVSVLSVQRPKGLKGRSLE